MPGATPHPGGESDLPLPCRGEAQPLPLAHDPRNPGDRLKLSQRETWHTVAERRVRAAGLASCCAPSRVDHRQGRNVETGPSRTGSVLEALRYGDATPTHNGGSTPIKPGSTVLRVREALVRLVRTCGEGIMQAGRLDDPFPARSAPSGWGPPGREETEPNPDGERPGGRDEMQRPRKTVDPG